MAVRKTTLGNVSLVPRVKVWLEVGGRYGFGLGICRILEAVGEAGSITEAARRTGNSYRYVWGRIREAERALGATLVDARVGGHGSQRSHLTPHAEWLIKRYRTLREEMHRQVECSFHAEFRDPPHQPGHAPQR